MHPRITELLEYVNTQTDELRRVYDAVPLEKRAVRPESDRWSPAEIVHHLVIVDRRLVQRLKALIEEARQLPPESETSSILSATVAPRAVNRERRFKTSDASEPRETDPSRVWGDLVEVRRELEQVVATGDGLALGQVTAPHPALGALTAYDWIAFVGAHAARHAEQIREMQLS